MVYRDDWCENFALSMSFISNDIALVVRRIFTPSYMQSYSLPSNYYIDRFAPLSLPCVARPIDDYAAVQMLRGVNGSRISDLRLRRKKCKPLGFYLCTSNVRVICAYT